MARRIDRYARNALEECVAGVRAGSTPLLGAYAVGTLAELRARAGERHVALDTLDAALRNAARSGAETRSPKSNKM